MSAKHTPGPWFIFGSVEHCVGGANTDPTTAAEHPTAGIAMCGMGRRLPDENAANARLIAAAPDLLEAAQAFVAYCRNAGLNVQPGSPADKARAAIAEATGSAQ
jgi:hypothetical protein